MAQAQTALTSQQQRERELQQQVADERSRADEMAAELERLRSQLASQNTTSPIPAFVSFLITVGSTRATDTGRPNTLVIPAGTNEVRLQVSLKEPDYPTYIAVLQAIGSEEIFTRQKIKPRTGGSGAAFTLSVPASRFSTGDYVLTLRGANDRGDVEDLSKSIFHIEKR